MRSSITAVVNDELKIVKGEMGSSAKILLNEEEAGLETKLNNGDKIKFTPGKAGTDAEAKIIDLIPEADICEYDIYLNGTKTKVSTKVFQNGKLVNYDQDLVDGAEIEYTVPRTVRDGLAQILEMPPEKIKNESISFTFNGQQERLVKSNYFISSEQKEVNLESRLEDGMSLKIEERENISFTIKELLQKKGSKDINIYFNNSELTVPSQYWEIEVNGESVEAN